MSDGRHNHIAAGLAVFLLLLAIARPIAELLHLLSTTRAPSQGALFVAELAHHPELREALREQEVIGYISDEEVATRIGGTAQARYYLSQFALAPVLLDLEHWKYPVRLMVFARTEGIDPYLNRHLLQRLVDVNENVVLVEPRTRP